MAAPSVVTLYGIPNCDTVRRARAWLATRGLPTHFHDFKKLGVPPDRLAAWCDAAGWESVLNRRGTSWRSLDVAAQAAAANPAGARELMWVHPSTIKRPVVEWPDGAITVGFDVERWAQKAGG